MICWLNSRYAFLELGVEDGVILARTDSLGAGLTQKIPVSKVSVNISQFFSQEQTIKWNALVIESFENFSSCNHTTKLKTLKSFTGSWRPRLSVQ